MNAILEICVMMAGGRRTGKTSVLAAMQGNFDAVFGGSNLDVVAADSDTLDEMERKRQEITAIYGSASVTTGPGYTPDERPSASSQEYVFNVTLKGRDDGFRIKFVDIPGEWFNPAKDDQADAKKAFVRETFAASDVFMITVDTPYMVWDRGVYNDKRNIMYRVTQMIKQNLEIRQGAFQKMVLFVPLKCERWLMDGKMDRVREKLLDENAGESYRDLVSFLTSGGYETEIAVTPIFTIGNVAFSRFEVDGDNRTILGPDGTPSQPLYSLTKDGRAKGAPEPACCEVPLLCALAYAMSAAEKQCEGDLAAAIAGERGAILARLRQCLSDPRYGSGIISDPLGFGA